jgi:ABC-2 type transport system ATP-binding protein
MTLIPSCGYDTDVRGSVWERDVTAVNGLNLEIRKGEMFGFLGPNGAGKTTTISMLCGLLKPTAGSAQIDGFDIGQQPQKVKERIGVCPQQVAV